MKLNLVQRITALITAIIIFIFEIISIADNGIQGFMWVVPICAIGGLVMIAFCGDGFKLPTSKVSINFKYVAIFLIVIGTAFCVVKFGFRKAEEAPAPAPASVVDSEGLKDLLEQMSREQKDKEKALQR